MEGSKLYSPGTPRGMKARPGGAFGRAPRSAPGAAAPRTSRQAQEVHTRLLSPTEWAVLRARSVGAAKAARPGGHFARPGGGEADAAKAAAAGDRALAREMRRLFRA